MYVVSSKEAKATASEGHNANYEENMFCAHFVMYFSYFHFSHF